MSDLRSLYPEIKLQAWLYLLNATMEPLRKNPFKALIRANLRTLDEKPYPKGPCTQIVHTLAPKYLYGDSFKANIYLVGYMDPYIVPEIAGSLLYGPQNKVSPNFRKVPRTLDEKP